MMAAGLIRGGGKLLAQKTSILAGVVVTAWLAALAVRGDEPRVYAVVNARILPVASAPLDKGTVVIRGGIIEAVGAGIPVPADARVIDGTRMTVYPGLIDALSDVALEEPRQPAATAFTGRGGRGATPPAAASETASMTPDERQGLTPYLQAADILNLSNRKIEAARAAGITNALVVPRHGFF
jgi:hypothetical protein